jgi:hypothetical protein
MSSIKRVSGNYTVQTIDPASTVTIQAGSTVINGNLSVSGSGKINPAVNTTTSASSITPNVNLYDFYAINALATGLTINAPTGSPADGTKLIFRILDNGTSRSLTWNITYTAIGVTKPSATTVNKTTYVTCLYNAYFSRWDVVSVTTQS